MSFKLLELKYDKSAFKPLLSEESFEYHHGKHLQAYVNNTNNLIKGTEFEGMQLEDIIKKSQGGLFNNSAQIYNHEFFFNQLSPNGGGLPQGELLDAINRDFNGFDKFKEEFTAKAAGLFGAGWCWLVKNQNGNLEIQQYSNAATPLTTSLKPIMTIDVWEHAYYIDYRNARPQFIEKFFEIIDWDFVSKQY